MRGRWLSVAEWTALFACVVPALLFNIAATLATEGSPSVSNPSLATVSLLALNIASVFAAPIAIIVVDQTIKNKESLIFLGALLVAGFSITHNITNALDKVAMSRATVSDGRQSVSQSVSRLMERRRIAETDLQSVSQVSQGVSADVIGEDLATLRIHAIYKRTQGCAPEKTDLQESKDWCVLYRNATKRHEAAKRAGELKIELAELDTKIESKGVVATDADPQVANLAMLLGLSDQRFLAVMLNTKTALLVEIIGTFGPMLVKYLFAWWGRGRRREEAFEDDPMWGQRKPAFRDIFPAEEEQQEEPLALLPPGPQQQVHSFVTERLEHASGAEVGATKLYGVYKDWCGRAKVQPVKQATFGIAMAALGFQKEKRKTYFYVNVAIK